MAYQYVLFDLDGTLLDTSSGILKSITYTLSKLQLPQPTLKDLKSFIGPPIQHTFQKYYNMTDAQTAQAAMIFRDVYSKQFLLDVALYPGILTVLSNLKKNGVLTAVATYKREDYTYKLLKETGLFSFFNVIRGSDFAGKLTKSDIVKICLQEMGVSENSKAVLVGDTCHDFNGAIACGLSFIGVTYGFGFQNKNEVLHLGACGVASSCYELIPLLL